MVKRSLLGIASGVALMAAAAGPAAAQSNDWTFYLSQYLCITDPTVPAHTPNGEVSQTLSFSDAIENLEFAFMGTVEARNGPWSVIGDLLYFKLAEVASTPNQVLFSDVDVESKTTVLSSYLTYRAYSTDTMVFDVGAGFRAFWTSLDTTFVGAAAPTESFSQDKNWVDPVVAARVRMAFNDQWFGTLMLDAGGYDDSTTWQALATVGYRLNDQWTFLGGYRYLQAEWDTDFGETSLEFSGPILGVAYRF
jgi:opacity protein-like surface antigen